MAIINKLKRLNQQDFKNQITYDRYFIEDLSIGNGVRTAQFKCNKCKEEYEAIVAIEKNKVYPGCGNCYRREMYPGHYRRKYLLQQFAKMDNLLGVNYDKRLGYRSRISHNGKEIHLGTFSIPEGAALAYDDYIIQHDLDRTSNEDNIPQ